VVAQECRLELTSLSKDELKSELFGYPQELIKHIDISSTKRLIRGIEVASYLSTHTFSPKKRFLINPLIIGLYSDVELRRQRILERLELRLKQGLVDEVENLINSGVSREVLVAYGLEYKFSVMYLNKEINMDQFKELLSIAINQYSKRQMTFFRKMEKDGIKINWFSTTNDFEYIKNQVVSLCTENLKY
jgi:tRNA dimethylallyltransferase